MVLLLLWYEGTFLLSKEVFYFKETQEIVGVDLSWGRIINYYNPKIWRKMLYDWTLGKKIH
jgi:hypothetical protein